MNSIKIILSIITPVYNVAPYLDATIKSILNQTYHDFELILVNDGSTDGSLEICRKYELEDSRVKVVTQKNQGVSAARNKGLEVVQGDIIGFVDSDDLVDINMYQRMIDVMKQSQADIVQCCHDRICSSDRSNTYSSQSKCECISGRDFVKRMFKKRGADYTNQVSLWSKIYKRELIEKTVFPIGQTYEDEQETYKICYSAKRIALIDDVLYHYIKRENSIITGIAPRKMLDKQKSLYDRLQWLPQREPGLVHECVNTFSEYSKHISCQLWKAGDKEHRYQAIKLLLKGIDKYRLELNRYDRLYMWMLRRNIGKSWILGADFAPIQKLISKLR